MKKKIIAIEGESASGKDSIAKYITKNFGIKPIVSFATRPMRDGEVNGREHWFITPEEMERIKSEEHMLAYTKIEDKTKVSVDGYEYCTTIESLEGDTAIYVIDPNGIEYMKSNKEIMDKIDLLVLYVYVPYEVRKERAKQNRSDFEKFEIRTAQESAQFEKMRNNKAYDYLIENIDYDQACLSAGIAVSSFLKKDD